MQVIWPVEFIRTEFGELNVSLNKEIYLQKYPFLKDANFRLTVLNLLIVNINNKSKRSTNNSKSRTEQKKIFEQLLASGKVDNQSDIARKFDVSRAWVSKVLNS